MEKKRPLFGKGSRGPRAKRPDPVPPEGNPLEWEPGYGGAYRPCPQCARPVPRNRLTCRGCHWVLGVTPSWTVDADDGETSAQTFGPLYIRYPTETYCSTCKQRQRLADAVYVTWDARRARLQGTCSQCGRLVRRTEMHAIFGPPLGRDLYREEAGIRVQYDPDYRAEQARIYERYPDPAAERDTPRYWLMIQLHSQDSRAYRESYCAPNCHELMPLIFVGDCQSAITTEQFWGWLRQAELRVLDDGVLQQECQELASRELPTYTDFLAAWKKLWFNAFKRVEPDAYAAQHEWSKRQRPRKALPPADRQAVYDRDGGICWICGQAADEATFELDHVWPRTLGGTSNATNLSVAHRECNIRRGNPWPGIKETARLWEIRGSVKSRSVSPTHPERK